MFARRKRVLPVMKSSVSRHCTASYRGHSLDRRSCQIFELYSKVRRASGVGTSQQVPVRRIAKYSLSLCGSETPSFALKLI
jgi:hypothetical protein